MMIKIFLGSQGHGSTRDSPNKPTRVKEHYPGYVTPVLFHASVPLNIHAQ